MKTPNKPTSRKSVGRESAGRRQGRMHLLSKRGAWIGVMMGLGMLIMSMLLLAAYTRTATASGEHTEEVDMWKESFEIADSIYTLAASPSLRDHVDMTLKTANWIVEIKNDGSLALKAAKYEPDGEAPKKRKWCEIALLDEDSSSIWVYSAHSETWKDFTFETSCPGSGTITSTDIGTGDFNGDGVDDILLLGKCTLPGTGIDRYNDVRVLNIKDWLQSGGAVDYLDMPWIEADAFDFESITGGDFDGDGKDNIAILDASDDKRFSVYMPDATDKWIKFELKNGKNTKDIDAGDFDRDGLDELYVMGKSSGDNSDVKILDLEKWMKGTGDPKGNWIGPSGHAKNYERVAAGDFDGKGMSAAMLNTDKEDVHVYDERIGKWYTFDTSGEDTRDMAACDFNGDGVDEVFILGRKNDKKKHQYVKVFNIKDWMDGGGSGDREILFGPGVWADTGSGFSFEHLTAGDFDAIATVPFEGSVNIDLIAVPGTPPSSDIVIDSGDCSSGMPKLRIKKTAADTLRFCLVCTDEVKCCNEDCR